MPLYDLRCEKCKEVTEDVIVTFVGRTVMNEDGATIERMEEVSDFVCPKCGSKRYKRLPANIGGIKIL